jgi:hypothetical protein
MMRAITFILVLFALNIYARSQESSCQKAVAVAVATPRGIRPTTYTPRITKFLQKNAKRYPDICLSVRPVSGAQNFAIIISNSSNVTNGVTPVVKTLTSTSSTDGSFNGSVTGNGGYWNFNGDYSGTTTTSTQTVVNETYTQTDSAIYFVAYDSNGVIIAQTGHVYSARTGGDGADTLGYNLGSALGSAGSRKRMYKRLFDAIESHN